MTENYKYTPRFKDMRIRPPKEGEEHLGRPEEDVLRLKPGEKPCEWPSCHKAATARAPKSREMINQYYQFCTAHAAEYNKTWNFFAGMSEGEARRQREAIAIGDRPTWAFRASRQAREAANLAAKGERAQNFSDPFSVFGAGAASARTQAQPAQRHIGKIERQALSDLDLDSAATPEDVKTRYKELLKRCHPDNNGGDRSAEDKLTRVIRAYKTLKKMGMG